MTRSLRDAFVAGATLFDAGEFWDAHEAWEERWRVETDANARLALQGLIQIAAALHHLVVKNGPESASRLFAKGLTKLDALPADFEWQIPTSQGESCNVAPDTFPVSQIDLASFREAIRACAKMLTEGRFAIDLIPKLSP